MANLSYREKADLEALFEMNSGYVMDFSNNSFARFVDDVINLDVYEGVGYTDYSSKANKLRQIWSNEPDSVVGTLLTALLSHCEDYKTRRDALILDAMEAEFAVRIMADVVSFIDKAETYRKQVSKTQTDSELDFDSIFN